MTTTTSPNVTLPDPTALRAIGRKYQVARLRLFGSAGRGEARGDSDVDVLVDFMDAARPTYLTLAELAEELSAAFARRVDLVMARDLHWYVRDRILAEARSIYEG